MASDEWDVAEQARWAGSALGGSSRPARQYRMTMAARSVHERDALAELESLLTNGAPREVLACLAETIVKHTAKRIEPHVGSP